MASSSQRKAWARFVAAADANPATRRTRSPIEGIASLRPFTGRILGIDPSLRGTGLAVVDIAGRDERRLVASRTLRIKPAVPFIECLGQVHAAVRELLEAHTPDHVAVEETIYVQNFRTAQILGAARGAAISAPASSGYPVFEYAPRRVKQAVAGSGAASKAQIARTIRTLLRLDALLPEDESDAAAVALCHAFTWKG